MKKFLFGLVVTLVIAGTAFAEVDDRAVRFVKQMLNGERAFTTMNAADANVTDDLAVTDDASIGGDVAITGDSSVGGSLTVTESVSIGALLALTPNTLAVTNGQAITPLYSSYVLQPPEAGTTNTIAVPYSTGDMVMFTVGATNAGSVTFADSTTVLALGGDVTILSTDVLLVYFTGTNTAVSLLSQTN